METGDNGEGDRDSNRVGRYPGELHTKYVLENWLDYVGHKRFADQSEGDACHGDPKLARRGIVVALTAGPERQSCQGPTFLRQGLQTRASCCNDGELRRHEQ